MSLQQQLAEAFASSTPLSIKGGACTLQIKEYSQLLRSDPGYAQKAKLAGDATFDPAEFLPQQDLNRLESSKNFHGSLFTLPVLCSMDFSSQDAPDYRCATSVLVSQSHPMRSSAGTYSLLQTQLSSQLRTNKIHALNSSEADIIATANIGCLLHLQSGTETPVEHWIEIMDKSLE